MSLASIKDDIKRCDKENALLSKEFNDTHNQVEELEN